MKFPRQFVGELVGNCGKNTAFEKAGRNSKIILRFGEILKKQALDGFQRTPKNFGLNFQQNSR